MTQEYIQRLLEAEPLRKPLLRAIIQALQLPRASRGLDAGCGIGLQMHLLAEDVGKRGHIDGVDILQDLLDYAAQRVPKVRLTAQQAFHQSDVSHLPFGDHTFDWVWSADCVGYPAGDLAPVLRELMRVLKPGGRVILLGWSGQQLLPGYPLLEARLNAHCSAYNPYLKDIRPEHHFLNAARVFRDAGLEAVSAQTFAATVQAPLTVEQGTALVSLFNMLWMPEGSPEDYAALQRLCDPHDAGYVLNSDDYYGFFIYSVFQGTTPRSEL